MKETWNYDLVELLKKAKLGDSHNLIEFLNKYPTLAAANEDYSVLVLLRHFGGHSWGSNNRMVMNIHPETEDFHWGIVIAANNENSSMTSNICLPNNRNYTGLKIKGKEIDIYSDDNQVVKTNVMELYRKLRFFLQFKEEDLEIAFEDLCNEQYQAHKAKKPKVKNRVIKLTSIGELKYNEKFEWYEGEIKLKSVLLNLSIYHTSPKKLENLLSFVTNQIQDKFHEKMLLEMEKKMIALKNDSWLGEEEPPITAKGFRKRISIESIVFHQDCSSIIYCKDADLFLGHLIVVNVDKKGNYESSNLAG